MKKVITAIVIMLLFTTASVSTTFAKSAQSLGSGDKYFKKWCRNKPNAPLEKKVVCDLIRKVKTLEDQDKSLDDLNKRVEDLEAKKEQMMVYDYDGNKLGVYAAEYGFAYIYVHYPDLNKLLPIDIRSYENPGQLGFGTNLHYMEPDCTGDPYLYTSKNFYSNKIIIHEGEHYIVEDGQPFVTGNLLSYRLFHNGSCHNINYEEREVLPLNEVDLPLPDPVTLPLQYRYE
jgi:hypothetical protein